MLTNLSVNSTKVALVRNSRDGNTPSVTLMGAIALKTGAAGITVHPRPTNDMSGVMMCRNWLVCSRTGQVVNSTLKAIRS